MVIETPYTDLERRVTKLEDRLEWVDQHGTRAIGALTLQVGELTKDIGRMEKTVQTLENTVKRQAASRWSTVVTLAIALTPLYALVISILVSHH